MIIKRWLGKIIKNRRIIMKKFNLDMIKNKDYKITSSKEALKEIKPFDWSLKK